MVIERTAYVSRPVIELDGQYVPNLAALAVAVMVTETSDGLYHCELTLNNFGAASDGHADYLFFGLEFGQNMRVELGNPPAMVFDGYISGLEAHYPEGGGATLSILAEDRLQELRMTRRTRSFEDMSDADIIEFIATEHGLTPQVTLDGPIHRIVSQVNLSDLAFIRERARCLGGEVWVKASELFATTRNNRLTATPLDLSYGAELKTFTVVADLAHQTTEVRVSGWDVYAKEAIDEAAGESAISSELDSGQSGTFYLERAFGNRVETVVHNVPLDSGEARGLAEASYRARARRFIIGSGVAAGDTRIQVGRGLNLFGLGRFDGSYYPVRVQHRFDLESGFQTEFDVERAGLAEGQT